MNIFKDQILKYRRFVVILAHLVFIAVAYIGAFYLRFELKLPVEYYSLILRTLPFILIIKLSVFYYFGLYSGMWRYVSMDDLVRILKANIVSTGVFVLFIVFTRGLMGFPRSVFVLDWGLCVGIVAGVRFVNRGVRERFRPMSRRSSIKTLIIGAGEAGILVLRELSKNPGFDIIGFIDDDPRKASIRLHGRKVMGGREDIRNIVDRYGIQEIIIAIPSAKGEIIRDVISCCQFPGVKVKIVPGMYKILSGELQIKLRDVQPEDLLGRETVQIDTSEIEKRLPPSFDNQEFWEKIAAKCVSCGICTFLCPTCYCFDINDEKDARYRNWDCCSFSLYTQMPMENPREEKWRRVRQKVHHKYTFYPRLFDMIACTGCGRCIRLCPVNWDITQTLNSLPTEVAAGTEPKHGD